MDVHTSQPFKIKRTRSLSSLRWIGTLILYSLHKGSFDCPGGGVLHGYLVVLLVLLALVILSLCAIIYVSAQGEKPAAVRMHNGTICFQVPKDLPLLTCCCRIQSLQRFIEKGFWFPQVPLPTRAPGGPSRCWCTCERCSISRKSCGRVSGLSGRRPTAKAATPPQWGPSSLRS